MKVISITGTSGSGKTTISEILNKNDKIKVINADKIAKNLTNKESKYLLEIKEEFKDSDIILDDGNLNRSKLANLIYNSKENLKKLNEITFRNLIPEIIYEIENVTERIQIVVIDAPLLLEAKLDKYCDYTIAVLAPEVLKIRRICKRDNISEEVAKSRLSIQQTDEFYEKNSDYIIINDENTGIDILKNKIFEIINKNIVE